MFLFLVQLTPVIPSRAYILCNRNADIPALGLLTRRSNSREKHSVYCVISLKLVRASNAFLKLPYTTDNVRCSRNFQSPRVSNATPVARSMVAILIITCVRNVKRHIQGIYVCNDRRILLVGRMFREEKCGKYVAGCC